MLYNDRGCNAMGMRPGLLINVNGESRGQLNYVCDK